MIELLGTIFEFVFDIIELGVTIAVGAVEFVFGLLGGLFSLLLGLGGIVLVVVLVCIFIKRRRRKERKAQEQRILVDENGEEFVSYYHQQEQ